MEVFDLGRAYSDAARIKALEAETADRSRRTDLYERSLTQTKEPTFEDAVNNYALVRAGAAVVMRDPAQAPAVIADLKRRGVLSADVQIPQGAPPEQIAQLAKEWYDQTSAALAAIDPSKYGEQATGPKIGQYNPGDYTPETWAQFMESKDPRGLKRQYAPPAPPAVIVRDVGGAPSVIAPTRSGTATVTPLSTPENEAAAAAAAAAAKARAEAQAKGDVENELNAPKRAEKVRQLTVTLDNVDQTIGKAIKQTNWATAGLVGSIAGAVRGSPAYDLGQTLLTIKANIGFDRLQQMREASPTGGALGQVAVQELAALQASLASLDQPQSPGQLRENLERIRSHYAKWRQAVTQSEEQQATPAPATGGRRLKFDSNGNPIP